MPTSRIQMHKTSSVSAGLAAAICMAISQLIALIISPAAPGPALAYGLSISSVAFGLTYAVLFFVSVARSRSVSQTPSA
jgi:hypothetical protein